MNSLHFSVLLGALLAVQDVGAFLGTSRCTRNECRYRRGHFHISTSQRTLQSIAFGRDIRTMYVTKDYTTTFDIVFVIKNIKNVDTRQTQLGIGAYTLGSNELHYATLTSTKNKIVYFRDVTNVQISLVSYELHATMDVYYWMDCGYKVDQFSRLEYPEDGENPKPILKSWDSFLREKDEEERKTCWFIIPRDNYQGWANIVNTYVFIANTSLVDEAQVKVYDLMNDKLVTSFPDTSSNEVDVSQVPGQNKTFQVGANDFPATTAIFVDLICPARYGAICRKDSHFEIMFKPLIKEDVTCIQIEEKCRFGRGNIPYVCKIKDLLPTDADRSNAGKAFTTSKCPALSDLLKTVSETVGKSQEHLSSDARMGVRALCSHIPRYCSSIRQCKNEGSCAQSCIALHARGFCDDF